MSTKTEREMAFEAGRAAVSEPADRATLDACPFSEGTDERAQWIAGFRTALDEDIPDPNILRKQLDDALTAEGTSLAELRP